MDSVDQLVKLIQEDPRSFCSPRSAEHYDQLLELYEEVGFGPSNTTDREEWRIESKESWSQLDSLIPSTTIVSMHGGRMVSSSGTIPLSSKLVYTHSVCMVKSLPGAVTLFAQALLSLLWLDHLPRTEWLAMGYAHSSRFTTRFQRPLSFTIPGQREYECVLCIPEPNRSTAPSRRIHLNATVSADESHLTVGQAWVYKLVSTLCSIRGFSPCHDADSKKCKG